MKQEKEKTKIIFVQPWLEKAISERARKNHRPWLREAQAILEQVMAEENKEEKR
jgi:hypothetical protein